MESVDGASSHVVDKIKDMLLKAIVKRISTAAASAIIPFIGWAIAIINVGLTAIEILDLLEELPHLVRWAEVEIDGYKYHSNNNLDVAKRYCGSDEKTFILALGTTGYLNSEYEMYYISMIIDGRVFITTESIGENYARNIVDNQTGPNLEIYTRNESSASSLAQSASGGRSPVHHTTLHSGLMEGFYHYPHADHRDSSYPAHVFYGEPVYAGGDQ